MFNGEPSGYSGFPDFRISRTCQRERPHCSGCPMNPDDSRTRAEFPPMFSLHPEHRSPARDATRSWIERVWQSRSILQPSGESRHLTPAWSVVRVASSGLSGPPGSMRAPREILRLRSTCRDQSGCPIPVQTQRLKHRRCDLVK